MFIPSQFEQTDIEQSFDLIEAYPFGTMVLSQDDQPQAHHLPFVLQRQQGRCGTLYGHVARANPVWHLAGREAEVLVIFQGPQSYISPSWYPSKQQHGKVLPTWNYMVAHVYGRLELLPEALLHDHLRALSDQQERTFAEPWSIDDAPADYIDKLQKAVVGLQIAISRIEAKWKLSQNRPLADRLSVVDALSKSESSPAQQMAEWIKRGTVDLEG